MSYDLNAMEVYVAVVDAGGFTAGGRRLGLSKSAVSKQVSALETQLGSRLLNRTTRKLSTTEAGLVFYDCATKILTETEAAEIAVGDLAHAPRGKLRINAPMSFGQKRLGPALAAFLAAYPDIELDISLNDRLVDLVEEGFDVAVRIGRLESSSLIARKLCPVKIILGAAPAYLASRPPLQGPQDLAGHRCLAYTLSERSAKWRLTDPGGVQHTVTVKPNGVANNGDLLLNMAIDGAGIVNLPDFVIDDAIVSGTLEKVLPHYDGESIAVYVVYPAVRHLAVKVRVFVDFLVTWFSGDR